MSLEENKTLVRRMMEAMNRGDLAALKEVIAPDFVHRNPGDPQMPAGPEGIQQLAERWLRAFPDGQEVPDDQIAEGDKVVTRWTFQGTHQGTLFGIAPTGRQVTLTGIHIDRIQNGKIVEHWDEADIAGLLQQLDASGS
jgi:steroid delta-isomerase-like uncharacterized protein